MSNSRRCEILLKIIDRVYEEYPDINNFVDTSKNEICRGEDVLHHCVFSVCFGFVCCRRSCLHHNLWLVIICKHKPKIKNDSFDYRFVA